MIALLLALAIAQDPPLNCADPQYQAEMNQCAARDFAQADAELNRLWREVIAAARANDREVNREFDQQPTHEETLRRAQRAWVTFRDAHCEHESFEARGGSMQSMLYEGCRAALTQERIRQLTPEPVAD
jgi:uncharacterized protein YecT (DUF1311 family)